jgi:hypothetical protein
MDLLMMVMEIKMRNNLFIRLLCSIPVILIFLYFLPFLGICLILLRYYVYSYRSKIFLPILLICLGLLIVLPSGIIKLSSIFNFKLLDNFKIFDSKIYSINLVNYSKLLITVGVIFLVLFSLFSSIFNKLELFISSYISEREKKDFEIRKENDMKMQEKREALKNTQVVHCPYCGADNMLTSNIGTCKYCRRRIEAKSR